MVGINETNPNNNNNNQQQLPGGGTQQQQQSGEVQQNINQTTIQQTPNVSTNFNGIILTPQQAAQAQAQQAAVVQAQAAQVAQVQAQVQAQQVQQQQQQQQQQQFQNNPNLAKFSEQSNKMFPRRGLGDLLKQIRGGVVLDSEAEGILLEIGDEFVESCMLFACRVARHRKSEVVDLLRLDLGLDLGNLGGLGLNNGCLLGLCLCSLLRG